MPIQKAFWDYENAWRGVSVRCGLYDIPTALRLLQDLSRPGNSLAHLRLSFAHKLPKGLIEIVATALSSPNCRVEKVEIGFINAANLAELLGAWTAPAGSLKEVRFSYTVSTAAAKLIARYLKKAGNAINALSFYSSGSGACMSPIISAMRHENCVLQDVAFRESGLVDRNIFNLAGVLSRYGNRLA